MGKHKVYLTKSGDKWEVRSYHDKSVLIAGTNRFHVLGSAIDSKYTFVDKDYIENETLIERIGYYVSSRLIIIASIAISVYVLVYLYQSFQ